MKTKSKKLKHNYNSKLKTSLTLSSKFRIFHFSFLALCLLTSLAGTAISSEPLDPTNLLISNLAKTPQDANTPNVTIETPQDVNAPEVTAETSQDVNTPNVPIQATRPPSTPQEETQTNDTAAVNSAAQADKKPAQSNPAVAANPNSHTQSQLWQASITVPKDQGDKKSKSELEQIIQKIRTVEFKPQEKAPEPAIVVEPAPTIEPNEISPYTEISQEPNQVKPKLPYEPVTAQTLQMLKNLSQHPEQLDNPFELGEVLFLSGHLKEAAIFYQLALNRKTADEDDSAQNRDWILLQIGNCLRNDDMTTAMKMYRQLIAEYPDSQWAELAKAQDKLIDWYQKDKPQNLINEYGL